MQRHTFGICTVSSSLSLLLLLTNGFMLAGVAAAPTQAAPLTSSTAKAQPASSPEEKRLTAAVDSTIAGNTEKCEKVFSGQSFDELTAGKKSELLVAGLRRVYKDAKTNYRRKQPDDALRKLKLYFSLISFVELNKVSDPDKEPATFLDTWDAALKKASISKNDYIAPLNDYGFYLQETGKDEPAVRVFQKVVMLEPSREVVYLNLADSLWKLGRKTEAAPLYEKYKKLMKSENLSSKVPARVDEKLLAVLKNAKEGDETDFGPFMAEMQRRIKRNWFPPRSAQNLHIVTIFKVDRDGHISGLRGETLSGVHEADEAALKAVSNTHLPPLPAKAPSEVDILFTFDYNRIDENQPGYDIINRWQRRVKELNSADNHVGLGQAYENIHRDNDAEREYSKALELQPGNLYYKRLLDNVTKKTEKRTVVPPDAPQAENTH
ncbi:MAG TPA: TonB C-terminal domain-containing protein [Oculatellaceae cyanobacterium]